jgi:ribosomal protein S18 acetylase RimI-like enzyme
MNNDVTLDLYDAAGAATQIEDLTALYLAAYEGTPQGDDPFNSEERFLQRLAGYMRSPGFALSTARIDDELVGYAFGYALQPGARWWEGLTTEPLAGLTDETGSRTFALNELHVRADHRGEGIASALHTRLLTSGTYERATILVRPDNPAADQYTHWGYRPIGHLKPFPDSPEFLALILPISAVPAAHNT